MQKFIVISQRQLMKACKDAKTRAKIKSAAMIVLDKTQLTKFISDFGSALSKVVNTVQDTGLNHDLQDLENAFPDIINYPEAAQANFADRVCMAEHKNIEFLRDQITEGSKIFDNWMESMNAKSVGNLAFVAQHSPKPYCDFARELLKDLKRKYHAHTAKEVN